MYPGIRVHPIFQVSTRKNCFFLEYFLITITDDIQ